MHGVFADVPTFAGPLWAQYTVLAGALLAAASAIFAWIYKVFTLIDRLKKELQPNGGGSMKDESRLAVRQNRKILRDAKKTVAKLESLGNQVEANHAYLVWMRIKFAREVLHLANGDLKDSPLAKEEAIYMASLTPDQLKKYKEMNEADMIREMENAK